MPDVCDRTRRSELFSHVTASHVPSPPPTPCTLSWSPCSIGPQNHPFFTQQPLWSFWLVCRCWSTFFAFVVQDFRLYDFDFLIGQDLLCDLVQVSFCKCSLCWEWCIFSCLEVQSSVYDGSRSFLILLLRYLEAILFCAHNLEYSGGGSIIIIWVLFTPNISPELCFIWYYHSYQLSFG